MAAVKSTAVATKPKAIYVDTSKCTGCRGCEVACKQWNSLPADPQPFAGSYQTKRDFAPNTYTFVRMNEVATSDGEVRWLFRKSQCMHCTDAACVEVCPKNAIHHTDYGTVYRDADKCIGCGYCVNNCTFGITKLDEVAHKATKCNFCLDRVEAGLEPACAKTCSTGAIQFGDREQMLKLAHQRLAALKPGFPEARIYGEQELGGTGFIYLLTDRPEKFGLPENPVVPWTVKIWQHVVRPAGEVMLGGTVLALLAAALLGAGKTGKVDKAARTGSGTGSNEGGATDAKS
ncbi:MAG: 4Fe-4S dicluster domain-containing protein [Firmicutes bacterium]|nr:4Fe-4S dicluster domain-containing protein [Bacillota bacterium]